ncbi:ethylbenzene dehydrogenase-related protein [Natronococcus pandeyae]|uniref:ethylbenzene dehydrogenase-related protein n=1 Tax=Natronococcus pandeyae TaxID=2055836 RepID=UPI001F3D9C4D|nr:ethylbenzene dehydrogenase-related protein [Natronococcus pandeyae]
MTTDRNQSDGADDDRVDVPADEAGTVLDGKPTLPGGTPKPLRRRFLKAMGATAVMGANAGCLGLFSDDPDRAAADEDGIDYAEIENFKLDWVPKQIIKNLNVKMAFNSEQFFFRFNWEQPDRGGWLHDYIVYEDGEWTQYLSPDPWVADGDHPDHRGFYEDRVTFLLDDGSVEGFENFGGWMTVHMGTRSLPGEASAEEVESDPHFGDDGLGRNDIRKYLPQSREGEWWESTPWDAVRPQEELDELKEDGVFVDLPMFRAHRSNPMEYGTDHHILDYRHGDEGDNTFGTQDWDEADGPEYMFDPEIVEDGALDIERLREADYRQDLFYSESDEWLGEYEPYYLHEDWMVEFDPEVAEQEGAAIPRRPLQEPEGSAADWRARGIHDDDAGEWTVEMWRDLETDHPEDTKQLEPGEVYDWMPAIHHGYNARWHWVAYPYKMGLGRGTDADFHAIQIEGEPDWDEIEEYTIPLIYPGMVDWTWLTSKEHRGYIPTRNNEMSIWDVHENPRRMAAMVLGKEIGEDPRR